MQKAILIICILIFSASSLKLFLMGGAFSDNQTEVYTNIALATGRQTNPYNCDLNWETTKCPRIGIITSASESQEQGNNVYNIDDPDSLSYKNLYIMYGFAPKHVSAHLDNFRRTTDINNADGQYNLEIVMQADVLFFNGGDQVRHARVWLNDDGSPNKIMKIINDRALRNQLVLSGSSAGAMIMCNPIYGQGIGYGHLYFAAKYGLDVKQVSDGDVNGTGNYDVRNGTDSLQYRDNGSIMPGFGFLSFLIDTHFDARGRLGRIVPGMVQTKNQIGIGASESTAIYYNNGKGTVYGRTGIFIIDLSGAIKISKQYFAINNVTISYLTSGDTFDFNTKKITPHSSKQLITKPTYEGFLDSIDIFGDNQVTKLLTRLGDQTQSMNIGRTLIPDGYPSNAPVFKLGFIRTSLMQSYWSESQKKYTIAKSTINFTYE